MGIKEDEVIINSEFIYNPLMQSLSAVGDDATILGVNESRLLQLLVSYPNEVISRNDIHDYVWRVRGDEVDDSSLTQAIATLRKFLGDNPNIPRCIKTEPRIGYRFIGNIELASNSDQIEQRSNITTKKGSFIQQEKTGYEVSLPNNINEISVGNKRRLFTMFDIRKHWYNFFVSGVFALIVMLVVCNVNDSQGNLLFLYSKLSIL